MALTVAQIESELIKKVGPLMAIVGFDGTTRTGSNSDLRQPIRSALRALGFACADPIAVTDTDMSAVTDYYVERLIDIALLTTYTDIMRLWIAALQKPPQGLTKEDLFKLRKDIEAEIARLQKVVETPLRTKSSAKLGYIGESNYRPPAIPNTCEISDPRGWQNR